MTDELAHATTRHGDGHSSGEHASHQSGVQTAAEETQPHARPYVDVVPSMSHRMKVTRVASGKRHPTESRQARHPADQPQSHSERHAIVQDSNPFEDAEPDNPTESVVIRPAHHVPEPTPAQGHSIAVTRSYFSGKRIGDYLIGRALGQGSMGMVFEATDGVLIA